VENSPAHSLFFIFSVLGMSDAHCNESMFSVAINFSDIVSLQGKTNTATLQYFVTMPNPLKMIAVKIFTAESMYHIIESGIWSRFLERAVPHRTRRTWMSFVKKRALMYVAADPEVTPGRYRLHGQL